MDGLSVSATAVMGLLMAAGLVMIPFSLPGLFVIAGSYLAFGLISRDINWVFFGILAGVAVLGEVLDFVVGIIGARKFGTSRRAVIGAVIGGIAGAILGSAIFLIGSVVGMFAGVFVGAYVFEYHATKDRETALQSAKGALLGRATAVAVKFTLGVICVIAILMKVY